MEPTLYYTYSDSLLRPPLEGFKRLRIFSVISYTTGRAVLELRGQEAYMALQGLEGIQDTANIPFYLETIVNAYG